MAWYIFGLSAVVALALLVTSEAEFALADSQGQDALYHPCIIEVYGIKNASLTEYRYTWTLLLSHTPHQCGCRFLLKDREGFPAAVAALKTYKQPSMVLIAARGMRPEEEAAIQANTEQTRNKLVVFHQSDERNDHTVNWYPNVKAVLRNYHRDLPSLKEHIRYLLAGLDRLPRHTTTGAINVNGVTGAMTKRHQQRRKALATPVPIPASPKGSNIYWIPLGFGDPFVQAHAMYLPIMSRPLLWSWTGSLGAKPERAEMVKYLNTTEMLQHGVLHTFIQFKGIEQLPPVKYSTLLYESKFMPLAPGIHPEQFRIYETLAAGAIPIALKAHSNAGLAHINLLRFKVLWINAWSEAPRVMKELLSSQSMQHELTAWQAHNSQQYVRVFRVIKQQIAELMCSHAKL